MGSKSTIIAMGQGPSHEIFRGEPVVDLTKSKELAARVLGGPPEPSGWVPLDLGIWPEPDTVCAASLAGFEIVCDQRLALERPSELTDWVLKFAPDRSVYAVFMHSVVDWAAFAVWERGVLRRSLSLLSDKGVLEDIGDRYSFEEPYWRGDWSIDFEPDYPLPFHPIELGNEALHHFFGIYLEGSHDDSDVDFEDIEVPAFRVGERR